VTKPRFFATHTLLGSQVIEGGKVRSRDINRRHIRRRLTDGRERELFRMNVGFDEWTPEDQRMLDVMLRALNEAFPR
jgi:hypothetical protein